MHVSFTDCTSVMTELSTRWSSLTSEQQDEWKCKASEGTHWLEKPRRVVVRDLVSAIEENVRITVDWEIFAHEN